MAEIYKRAVLKGSRREELPGGRDAGAADPKERIVVSIVLRRRPPKSALNAAKSAATKNAPRIRKYLSREQFVRRHGASAADIAKVRSFAKQYGLRVASEDRASRTVKLSGTVQSFNKAFETDLRRYEHSWGSYRCRTGELTIPARLKSVIEGVFGLDNRPQAKTHFRIRKVNPGIRAHAVEVSYSPVQVAQAYAFPADTTGAGQCIALIELGGGYKSADLTSFFKNLGIKSPKVTAVSVDGARNSPTGESDGPDGEVELDIEVAGAAAPGAKIAVYFAPNTDQGFIDAVGAAVHDSKRKPSTISISWGGPENSWTEQSRNALNSAFEDASTMGISVLAASGDDGASDGSSDGKPTVDFPAASPYVTGCGGTKLTISGSSIGSEQVWNELASNEGATGGGVSENFALPRYQKSARVPKAPNDSTGRGVPDVAGNADPATGYNVTVDGKQTVIGGTSAVAPLWAALVARINQSLGKNVGFLNPMLYLIKADSSFHDITSGSNGGYSATRGWDACTGLGSPNGTALLKALK
ncbi:MAG TPA: S53 family peptidase [Candidatus Acidoferrales bacterium]|nr:S53 family peptidase [Candidatus Acidoferrales bacterium]